MLEITYLQPLQAHYSKGKAGYTFPVTATNMATESHHFNVKLYYNLGLTAVDRHHDQGYS